MPYSMAHEVTTATAVVRDDLERICAGAAAELDELSGHHVLITGGAGFLGYYLVQALCHRNRSRPSNEAIRLTVFDNFVRGAPPWLTGLATAGELVLVHHDVTRPPPADSPDFAYVIHAASIASPTYYRKHPIETMDANVNGLRHLLDYAVGRQRGGTPPVRGFLFFSTSEIYGDPPADQIPTTEDYRGNVSCTGPRACYDESKRYGETLCVNFAARHEVPVRVARPFNNYGPGLKVTDRRVIPDFVRDILAGRDVIMLSDGSPTRTFCYVADAVTGYFKVLVRGRGGEAYNIGVEQPEITMAELAERLIAHARDLCGYRGRMVRRASEDRAYLQDNPNRRCPSIAKARAELGFEPRVDLDEGLRRSLIWYLENREAEDA